MIEYGPQQVAYFAAQPVGTIMYARWELHHSVFIKLPNGSWEEFCAEKRNLTWPNEEFAQSWNIKNDNVAFS